MLERPGTRPEIGIPWLDAAATDPAVVRMSRGAGLPAPLPDLLGLAIRLPGGAEPVDLLLSTTGRRPGRCAGQGATGRTLRPVCGAVPGRM